MDNKPWNAAQFELKRPHMSSWVRETIVPILEGNANRLLVVRAPVKSGKREIAEYISMRDMGINSPRIHGFISAWHRTADNSQRKELEQHNMTVFSINNKSKTTKCSAWIDKKISLGKKVVLHLDECDYGSGSEQILSTIYRDIRNNPDVLLILYSATPEEVLFSSDMKCEEEEEVRDGILRGVKTLYTPPPGYCGPERFLREGLIHDAAPFFKAQPTPIPPGQPALILTEQGRQIIQGLKDSTATGGGRNIVILRLTKRDGGAKKENKDIYKFLENYANIPEMRGVRVWVDKNDYPGLDARKIEWSNQGYWGDITSNLPYLIIHDQTSSRSTEWACHDRVFATHDYRTTLSYTSISQAQERVNHYDSKYNGGFQRINVYGHRNTFRLSAGVISYEDFFECEWSKVEGVDPKSWIIKNKEGLTHPNYSNQMTKANASAVLKAICCDINYMSLASRVGGRVCKVDQILIIWFQCDFDNFDARFKDRPEKFIIDDDIRKKYKVKNPFRFIKDRPPPKDDGKIYGYLRRYDVFEYADVDKDRRWGVDKTPRLTICYRQNVLGVAVRWATGENEIVNTMVAYRSMYPSK